MKCSHCGENMEADRAASNAEREIVLRIPERHFELMRKTFREMEMKLGMHGYGELANALKPYGKEFERDFAVFRYFDEGAMATASLGVTWGYRGEVVLGEIDARNRRKVHIDFTVGPGGKTKRMLMSDCATPDAADIFKEWFDDLQERLSPPRETALEV